MTTIELQWPQRRNALNSELVQRMQDAVVAAVDADVKAVVLTGQGSVFCAGADLSGDAFAADYPDRLNALQKTIDEAPLPVIGAINGPAIGAGLRLAMICDLRVVAPGAFFQLPTAKYGLALDNWSIRRLASLVGHGRARAMLLGAEKLTAETALLTGMANRIGTPADARAGPPRSPALRHWHFNMPSETRARHPLTVAVAASRIKIPNPTSTAIASFLVGAYFAERTGLVPENMWPPVGHRSNIFVLQYIWITFGQAQPCQGVSS